MAFYTADEFREIWDVVEQISGVRIGFCQETALDELRMLVGDAAVEDALANDPTDLKRAGLFKRAHAYLTAEKLVWNTGTRMRPFGLTKIERDTDASVSSNVQTEYQSAKDVKILADSLRASAERLLEPYLLRLSGDEDVGFSSEFETGTVTLAEQAEQAKWEGSCN